MKNRHLFLFGSSPPFGNKLGRKFAELSFNQNAKIAILFVERDGWEKYMPRYTEELKKYGVFDFVYLPLSSDLVSNIVNELNTCTGIIIGGGETELYHHHIVETAIGVHIKKLYAQGIPIAGFSAGTLIIPENCIIPPIDNTSGKQLYLRGLGLIKECVISVHFTKWNEEKNLNIALSKTNALIGYGIDDEEGIYFKNESVEETEGEKYYVYRKQN